MSLISCYFEYFQINKADVEKKCGVFKEKNHKSDTSSFKLFMVQPVGLRDSPGGNEFAPAAGSQSSRRCYQRPDLLLFLSRPR